MKRLLIGALSFASFAAAQVPQPLDYRIPPPQVETMTEVWMKAQKARNLQLQNNALEQDIAARQLALNAPQQPVAPRPFTYNDIHTYGVLNGRGWLRLTDFAKTMYLSGMSEGIAYAATPNLYAYFSQNLSLDEIRFALDRFFGSSENTLVQVVEALKVITLQVKGTSKSEIDSLLAIERKVAFEAPERKSSN